MQQGRLSSGLKVGKEAQLGKMIRLLVLLVIGIGPNIENQLSERFSIGLSI